MMFNVLIIIDWKDDSGFTARVHPQSTFEDFDLPRAVKAIGPEPSIYELHKKVEKVVYGTIDNGDHYGKLVEQVEIYYEYSDKAYGAIQAFEIAATKAWWKYARFTCVYVLLLLYFIITFGYWVISNFILPAI